MRGVASIIAALLSLGAVAAFTQPAARVAVAGARPSPSSTSLASSVAAGMPGSRSLPEGVSKTTTVEGTGRNVRVGDMVVVKYFCTAAGSDAAFARSDRQRVVAGDGTMIRGWDAALLTMREGERASVVVSDPRLGYGEAGVPPFVPGGARIEIDVEVLDVEDNVGLGAQVVGESSSALDMMDGPVSRPRTPAAIAAAYEAKMKAKAINAPEEKEGIEWAIDKVKNSYFFGLFEGETGQEAPWYLKPSITFPIAFLVVGAAFWASLAGGAISERGMPTTDELDEIIISSAASFAVALSMIQM